MKPENSGSEQNKPAPKKAYTPPRLERFGTVRDLTLGTGNKKTYDGSGPQGHNKTAF